MTEILESPSQLSSSPSSIPCVPPTTLSDESGLHQQMQTHLNHDPFIFNSPTNSYSVSVVDTEQEGVRERKEIREKEEGDQISLLAVLVTVFRKSMIACRSTGSSPSMEIGLPTNVRHVAHVTFDRFNGFLGLPVEFAPQVPSRPPSASTSVFGVSIESMQLSFDSRGNSVPTILLMMQSRLYDARGLQAEGIFRINAENGQEEYVREQLNRGIVPHNIDAHCLAGLIKAWFRELPNGLLDSIPPEEVMQAQSEKECAQLVRRLPGTEAALLDWAINLMADVAQLEHLNKMSARNIAMVFAPNMTKVADPLTALMHAVQVMNFLKTLVEKTLKEREDLILEQSSRSHIDPSDENGHCGSLLPLFDEADETNKEEQVLLSAKETLPKSPSHPTDDDSKTKNEAHGFLNSIENIIPSPDGLLGEQGGSSSSNGEVQQNQHHKKSGQKKGPKGGSAVRHEEKSRATSMATRVNSKTNLVEAWR